MPLATLSPPKIPDSFSFPNIYFNEHLIVFSLSLFSQIVSHFKYIYIYIFFKFHSQNQTTTTKIIRKKCVNMYSILLGCSTIFIFVPLLHFSRSNCVLLTDNWTPFCVARAMLFFFYGGRCVALNCLHYCYRLPAIRAGRFNSHRGASSGASPGAR